MRWTLAVLFLSATVSTMAGEPGAVPTRQTLWLPIVATRSTVDKAFESAAKLQRSIGELQLVDTTDCQNLRKGLYLVVAGIYGQQAAAKSAIDEWRNQGVNDAYLRSCEVVVPSRLSLSIPLLDPSLMQNSIEAVNWGLEDAVSRVVGIDSRFVAAIVPRYQPNPEDIREGLRIGVRLYNLDEHRAMDLSAECIDPEFSVNATHVALTCVNESAADHLLHRTQLFTLTDGKLAAEKNRCTQPVFKDKRWVCQKESVDAEGVLKLEAITLSLEL